jgi:hypothetical protein
MERTMERKAVESSMIKSYGHDPETNTLEVEFKNGKIYTYPCNLTELQALAQAASIGKHFNDHFKGRK